MKLQIQTFPGVPNGSRAASSPSMGFRMAGDSVMNEPYDELQDWADFQRERDETEQDWRLAVHLEDSVKPKE